MYYTFIFILYIFCVYLYLNFLPIRSIKRDDLVTYINKHYSAPRMVLAAAGGKENNNLKHG